MGPTIAIADDSGIVRRITRAACTAAGLDLLEAATGVATMDLLGKDHIDLVILDFNLGDMCSTDIAAAIRIRHPACKILLISGFPVETIRDSGIQFDSFLAKPFTGESLLAEVDHLIHQNEPAARLSV